MSTKAGNLLGHIPSVDWGLFFIRGVLFLILGIALFLGYKAYSKFLDTKYKAIVKYNTMNGIRIMNDNVLSKKHKSGKQYYFLEKLKIVLPKIDPSNITYRDKGKPVIELFLDQEKNIHPIKFIQDRPVYGEKNEILRRVPIAIPYQTGEEKSEFASFLREKNLQYAGNDMMKYATVALIGTGIVVMAFIIVAAKVA